MSDDQNKDLQEKISYLKAHKTIQVFGATMAYTTAAFMLACTASLALTHDSEHISDGLLWGAMGTFDCYLGDLFRKRYKVAKNALNELKKQQYQNQK